MRTFSIYGYPPPVTKWQFKSSVSDRFLPLRPTNERGIIGNETTCGITISKIREEFFGIYKARVMNNEGALSLQIHLQPTGKICSGLFF